MRISLVILSLVTAYVLAKQEIYTCFTDLCNVDTGPQFCSSTFKLCRDCKEIIQDCYTPKQPSNCSQYCEANLCTDVERMLTIANSNASAQQYNGRSMIVGSEIIYGCNAGYKIDGSTKIMCLGNNTWSEKSVPVCFHRSQLDMAINQAFESKKMEEEKTCFVLPMMTYLVNGDVIAPKFNDSRVPFETTFRHICHNGYTLKGPVTQKCLGNDTWSEIETPYCLDDTWTSYKHATLFLGIFSAFCCLTAVLLAIVYLLLRKGKQISRTNTDDSFPEQTPLLPTTPEDQNMHTEDEHISFTPTRKRDDGEKPTESPVTSSTRPTAPPVTNKPQHENKIGQQNNINNSSSVNNQTGLQLNIQLINHVNGNNSPEDDGKSAEKPMEGATSANQTRQRNRKRIDVKMPTEEANETDVTEESDETDATEVLHETEAVNETASDAKSRGTKPLPARGQKAAGAQEEMSKGNDATGPQAVTAKDESIQSPTKETGQDRPPGKLGFDHATFPSTERSEIQADVAEYPNEVGSTQRLDELKEGIGTNVQTTA